MKITQLLTKNQEVQFMVFEYLLYHDVPISLKELEQEIHVSLPTLQKELLSLQVELTSYDRQAKLVRDQNDFYELKLPNHFSVKDFLTNYLQQSLDYQLFLSVFYQKNISITKMMMDLQVSESSIFRRFKAINQLLAEFDVQIKNKNIIGSEKQIRYFFFHFFWHSHSYAYIQQNFDQKNSQHLIQIIETLFERKFTPREFWKLVVWFNIMEHRFDYHEDQIQEFSTDFLQLLEEDLMFQKLKNILARFLSRFAYQSFEDETIYLYLFLLSEGIYIPQAKESSLIKNIYESSQLVQQQILGENQMTDKGEEFLFILHCTATFYRGSFEEEMTLSRHYALSDISPDRLDKCMSIVEKRLARHLTNTQWKILDFHYGLIYDIFHKQEKKQQRIGIVMEANLESEYYLSHLKKSLQAYDNIHVEEAIEGVYYHLLLVNEFVDVKLYTWETSMIITERYTPHEIKRVKELLIKNKAMEGE